MQAIYEVILSIPENPLQATKQLFSLSKSIPNFIETLKNMAVELYQRFNPKTIQQLSQYQTITKQMLTLFNRFIFIQYKEKSNNFYMQTQNYYIWMIDLLICQHISLSSKKVLVGSFVQVLNSINYSLVRIESLVDFLMKNGNKASHSIFIYFQALQKSNLTTNLKIESLKIAYQYIFYAALGFYQEVLHFYKHQYMQIQIGQKSSNSNFAQKLKENEYILNTICNLISFIYNLSISKKDHISLQNLAYDVILHPQLASYLSKILKIQIDLFDSSFPQNLYGLNILIVNNLRNSEKIVINKCKGKCLATLKLILSITDKNFNLKYTDKLLMKELPNLASLILKQLYICSHNNLVQKISIQVDINSVLSSMFDLLSQIVKFQDLKGLLQNLNVEDLIRLTLCYMKTYEQEMKIYEFQAQEYFHLIGYICNGKIHDDDHEINLTLGQFCMKRHVTQFIKQMSKFAGFQSLLLQICSDYIRLQVQTRNKIKKNIIPMFLDKYKIKEDILQCFNLQSTLFTFTILLQNACNECQKRKNLLFLLEIIPLDLLSDLELCRVYMCLGIYNDMFKIEQIQTNYYYYITKIYKMTSKCNSLHQSTYNFLISLFINNHDTQHYKIFLQKILIEMSQEMLNIKHKYLITTILQILKIRTIKELFNLAWLNCLLGNVNLVFNQDLFNSMRQDRVVLVLELGIQLLHFYWNFRNEEEEGNMGGHFQEDEKEFLQFYHISTIVLNQQNVLFLMRKLDSYHHIEQEDQEAIYLYGRYLFFLLVYSIPLNQQQTQLILKFTLKLLIRQTDDEAQLKKISFELLYQLINTSVLNFTQEIHQIIFKWMKSNYYKGQVILNRVVIILQELYYYIFSNIFQRQYEFIQYYSSIFEIVEKKFNAAITESFNLIDMMSRQTDKDVRKINQNLKMINFGSGILQTHPITIIRLYNTILLNPYFDIQHLHKFSELFDKYSAEIVPTYDLAVSVLSFSSLSSRCSSFIIIPCFNLLFRLLKYNAIYDETHRSKKDYSHPQKQIANVTKQLKSSITITDPYQQFHRFISKLSQDHQKTMLDNMKATNEIRVDLIDYIKGSKGMLNDIMKISRIRKINDKSRTILKVKKEQYE